MSFEAQERALFDLLFDARLRQAFVQDSKVALAPYALSPEERADFDTVRLDALELDAQMRCDLILQHMCRALPVSFSIASSLAGGLEQARRLIDTSYIRTKPGERASHLGQRLRSFLTTCEFASGLEQSAAVAICDAELGMVTTAAGLRKAVLTEAASAQVAKPYQGGWGDKPLSLAPHVSITMLSQPYTALKRALCPVSDAELWARLSTAPLPAARRTQTLAHESPRLFVARAHAVHAVRPSACEVTVDHRMLELSPGFGPLLSHLDGKISVADLLAELRKAGAADRVCDGVRAGFASLIEQGMVLPRA